MALVRAGITVLLLAALGTGCYQSTPPNELPTPPATPIFDHAIVPGRRAGPIALGMTARELFRVAGPNSRAEGRDGEVEYHYADFSAVVSTANERVTSISVTAPEYATESGASVGMNEAELLDHAGGACNSGVAPGGQGHAHYEYRGMTAWLDENGIVSSLEVNTYKGC